MNHNILVSYNSLQKSCVMFFQSVTILRPSVNAYYYITDILFPISVNSWNLIMRYYPNTAVYKFQINFHLDIHTSR